jgi:hypothetical protein
LDGVTQLQIPPGILELLRRYSSRKLLAVLGFIYLVKEWQLTNEQAAGLGFLVMVYLVMQGLVEIAQCWGTKPVEKPEEKPRRIRNAKPKTTTTRKR